MNAAQIPRAHGPQGIQGAAMLEGGHGQTLPGSTAVVLVGTHTSSGSVLALGQVPDGVTLDDAIAGWALAGGWHDVHPAVETVTYQRIPADHARRLLTRRPARTRT